MAQPTRTSRRNVWLGLALVLVLGIAGYRAANALSGQPVESELVGASPLELRLTGLLETVMGAGHVQVHRSERPDGSQAFLVVINNASAANDPGNEVIERLLSSAVFLDPLAGDTVVFDRVTFVHAAAVWPDRATLLELLALVSACALIGAGMLSSATDIDLSSQVQQREEGGQPARRERVQQGQQNLIAQRISEDPVRAAKVIRRWLGARAIDT